VWPASAVARRALADSRARTLSFAVFFALIAFVQPVGYRHSYSTLAERIGFARSFGANKAIRLFYGTPHDLLTVGGYAAWRVAGILSIFGAMWGILASVRALRTEEESGRTELVLAGLVTRRTAFLAALAAIAAGAVLLWIALLGGLLAASLPAAQSAYLALATMAPAAVFVGIGAVASQLAPTRRLAIELSSAVLVAAFLLRVVADTSASLAWLRWATPLGWAEELRPFAGAQPAVLLLPVLGTALLCLVAGWVAVRRDVGASVLAPDDSAEPRLHLLSSPAAHSLRAELGTLAGWLVGIGFFALVMGVISNSFSSTTISGGLRRQLERLGAGSIVTPRGALGFYFLLFVVALSLFACAQISATRREEADQHLETLFALPVSRRSWLVGRLLLAGAAATVLALAAGLLAWAGAASQGVHISPTRMLEAGANCLPATLLFLALGALAYAILPRAAAGIAYGLVSLAFVWELFGALLGAPSWSLGISPFHQIGLVPAQPFRATAAAIMLAIAVIGALAAVRIFERRDLAVA
jgi:ABC-2 type transport system permease protein